MNFDFLTRARRYLRDTTWVWIDLDDTLIDFHTNSRRALELTYTRVPQLPELFPSADDWKNAYLTHNHALWDRYNRAEITQDYLRIHRFTDPLSLASGTPNDTWIPLARELDTIYLDLLARQTAMIPGARSLVGHLRRWHYNIGVLSNGFVDVQHRKLDTVGLTPLVDLVVLSDDIGVNKPDLRLYRHAMERAGCPDPACHLMIGDNPSTDIAGAIGAGWKAILLDPSAPGPTITERGIIIPRLSDATRCLEPV